MNRVARIQDIVLEALEGASHHGYTITCRIRKQSDDLLPHGDSEVYAILRGMENDSLVETYVQEEGGLTRYYYRLTDNGDKTIRRKREQQEAAQNREHPFAIQPRPAMECTGGAR